MKNLILLALTCISVTLSMNPLISQAQEKDHTQDFNFWIGTWDVYQNGTEKIVGESHISSILGGNAIREEYSSKTTNYSGSSLNAYNKSEDRWEQYYLDNGGLTLHITGGLVDGKMVLQNKQVVNGENISNKLVGKPYLMAPSDNSGNKRKKTKRNGPRSL